MKDFDTLESILYAHSNNKIIPGLERISRLLERLGNPQNSFKAIHIVGTNGKGSTGAFISSVFQASGYKTGFYSSPHLASPGERLLIDGEELSAEEWIEAANEAVSKIFTNAASKSTGDGKLTASSTSENVSEIFTNVAPTSTVGEKLTTSSTSENVSKNLTNAASISTSGEKLTASSTDENVGKNLTSSASRASSTDDDLSITRPPAPKEELPSYFELLTAAAFVLAKRKNIDVGIIEAGLGGRLDATNLLGKTVCSVIASISMDHMEYLGPTLQDIAGEKFAVVKENIPACFSGVDASLIPLFKEFCACVKAVPFVLSENVRVENVRITPEGNIFDFYAPNLELKEIMTGLIGDYQIQNAALALSAISLVKNLFPKITEDTIRKGMFHAKWPGRLEVISREPLIILDGGHNYDGVKKLCESVKTLWPDKKFAVVYAAMKDKDYTGGLELLSENLRPSLYATTVPNMTRAAKPEDLLQAAENFIWANSPEGFNLPVDAVKKAISDKNDGVIVCGSLYLVGYVKRNNIFG